MAFRIKSQIERLQRIFNSHRRDVKSAEFLILDTALMLDLRVNVEWFK